MDGMKNIKDELSHAQDLLVRARNLTDEAITLGGNPQEIQKAFQTLAGAAQSQNAAFEKSPISHRQTVQGCRKILRIASCKYLLLPFESGPESNQKSEQPQKDVKREQ